MLSERRPPPPFLRLRIAAEAVVVGERVKKGTFRPCVENLPTSTVMGCMRDHFGMTQSVAIGLFDRATFCRRIFTYAPFDAALGTAKLPLTVEYLAPRPCYPEITGDLYVLATDEARLALAGDQRTQEVRLGALKSRGFGRCRLTFAGEVQPQRRVGILRAGLRETDAPDFGIDVGRDVILARYGYLFRPDGFRVGGRYERALLEGTHLAGPDFLLDTETEYKYDR